jgi:hypothetical protein
MQVFGHKSYVPNLGGRRNPYLDWIQKFLDLQAQSFLYKFSTILTPTRLGGKWMVFICDMRCGVAGWIIFVE